MDKDYDYVPVEEIENDEINWVFLSHICKLVNEFFTENIYVLNTLGLFSKKRISVKFLFSSIGCLKLKTNFATYTGNTCDGVCFLMEIQVGLRYRHFPTIFAKFLETPFLKNTSGWFFLDLVGESWEGHSYTHSFFIRMLCHMSFIVLILMTIWSVLKNVNSTGINECSSNKKLWSYSVNIEYNQSTSWCSVSPRPQTILKTWNPYQK